MFQNESHERPAHGSGTGPKTRRAEPMPALVGPLRTRISLKPGRPGTRELLARHGDRLVCVRHRWDEHTGRSFKTVELIVEETAWKPRKAPASGTVELKVDWHEEQVREAVKGAGGWWNRQKRTWELRYDRVVDLGLADRIVRDRG